MLPHWTLKHGRGVCSRIGFCGVGIDALTTNLEKGILFTAPGGGAEMFHPGRGAGVGAGPVKWDL